MARKITTGDFRNSIYTNIENYKNYIDSYNSITTQDYTNTERAKTNEPTRLNTNIEDSNPVVSNTDVKTPIYSKQLNNINQSKSVKLNRKEQLKKSFDVDKFLQSIDIKSSGVGTKEDMQAKLIDRLTYQEEWRRRREQQYRSLTGDNKPQRNVNTSYNVTKQQEDDYTAGWSVEWYKDVWSSLGQRMNEAQVENFKGAMIRNDNLNDVISAAAKARDNDDKRDLLNEYFKNQDLLLSNRPKNVEQRNTLVSVNARNQQIRSELQKLYPEQVRNNQFNDMFLFQEQQRLNNFNVKGGDNISKYELLKFIDGMGPTAGLPDKLTRQAGELLHRTNTKERVEEGGIDWFKTLYQTGQAGVAGATTGAAVGSIFSPIGTGVGAVAGGVIGSLIGLGISLVSGETGNLVSDDATENVEILRGFNTASKEDRARMLDRYNKRNKINRDYWDAAIKKNEKERQYYEKTHPVSLIFKKRAENAPVDVWSMQNIMYRNMDLLGYSMSSWDKQAIGMMAQLNPATAIMGSFNTYSSGREENNMEVSMSFYERLSNILPQKLKSEGLYKDFMKKAKQDLAIEGYNNLSDEYILSLISQGKYYPNMSQSGGAMAEAIQEAAIQSRKGSNATFERDMAAVAGDAITEGFIYTVGGKVFEMPFKALKWVGSTTASRLANSGLKKYIAKKTATGKLYSNILKNELKSDLKNTAVGKYVIGNKEAISNFVKENITSPFKSGYKYGSPIGVFGSGLTGTANIALQGAKKGVSKIMEKNWAKAAVKNVDDFVTAITSAPREIITGAFKKAASSKIIDKASQKIGSMFAKDANKAGQSFIGREFAKRTANRTKDFAKRFYVSGISESIEEGKQNQNAEAWVQNENPSNVTNWFDTYLNDLSLGVALIPGTIGASLGMRWGMCADNPELYADQCGGLLGGVGHHVVIQGVLTIMSDVAGAISGKNAVDLDKAVVNNAIVDHNHATGRYERTSNLAKQILGNSEEAKQQFDNFKQFNESKRQSSDDFYSDEEIQEEQKLFDTIQADIKNKSNIVRATMLGITSGSNEYAQFIAAKHIYGELYREHLDDLKKYDSIESTLDNLLLGIKLGHVKIDAFGDEIDTFESPEVVDRILQIIGLPKGELLEDHVRRGIKQLSELVTIKKMFDVLTTAEQWENVAKSADMEFVKSLLTERMEQLSKNLDVENLDNIDEQLKTVINDDSLYENLTDFYQGRMGSYVMFNIAKMMNDAINNNPKEVIKALNKNVKTKYDVIDNLNYEYQTRYVREQKEKRKNRIQLTAEQELIERFLNSTPVEETNVGNLSNPQPSEQNQETTPTIEEEQVGDASEQPVTMPEDTNDQTSGQQQADMIEQHLIEPELQSEPYIDNAPILEEEQEIPQEEIPTEQQEQNPAHPINESLDVQPEPTQPTVTNTIFTEERYRDALARLKKKRNNLNSGIDPEMMEIGASIFGYHVEKGIRKFAALCHTVVKDLIDNEFDAPFIKDISKNFKSWYGGIIYGGYFDNEGFDSLDVVQNTDIDAIIDSELDRTDIENTKAEKLQELKEKYKKQESADAIYNSIQEALNTEHKTGDVILIMQNDFSYRTFLVTKTKNNKIDYLLERSGDGILWVTDGNILPESQRIHLQNMAQTNKTNVQQEALNQLNEKIEQDNKNVVGVSGYCYFIKNGDKIIMYPRVHTINGDLYEQPEYEKENYNKLRKELQIKSESELIEYINENKDKIGDSYKHFITVLKQRDLNLHVVKALATILSRQKPGVSVLIGQVVDEIVRMFFDNGVGDVKSIDYNTLTVNVEGMEIPVSEVISEDRYNKFVKNLVNVSNEFKNRGWLVSTKRHTWYGLIPDGNGNIIPAAGETDIIAIDENGNYIIIDTKTSKKSFAHTIIRQADNVEIEGTAFYNVIDLYDGRKAYRSTYDQYSMQQSTYMAIINSSMLNITFAEHPIFILPVRVDYDYNNATEEFKFVLGGYMHETGPFAISSMSNGETINGIQEPILVELTPTDNVIQTTTIEKEETEQEIQEEIEEPQSVTVTSTPSLKGDVISWQDHNTADRMLVETSSDGKGHFLSEVTGNLDFAENATFEVVEANYAYVKVVPRYKGVTYSAINIQITNRNDSGDQLRSLVRNAMKNKKPGQKVFLTGMIRTQGVLQLGADLNVLDSFILNGVDISTVSSEYGSVSNTLYGNVSFGLAKSKDGVITIVQTSQKGRREISLCTLPKGTGVSGAYYAVIRMDYKNAQGYITSPAPVILAINNYSKSDVDAIVEILQTIGTKKYEVYTNDGNTKNIPLSHTDVLNLILSVGTAGSKWHTNLHVIMEGQTAVFTYKPTSSTDPGERRFNIFNEYEKAELYKFLQSKLISIDSQIADCRLGNEEDANNPFKSLKTWFENNPSVNEIRIGNTNIIFRRSDFEGQGISGLAWYMRNGFLKTNVIGIGNPRFSFTAVETKDEVEEKTEQPVVDDTPIISTPEYDSPTIDVNYDEDLTESFDYNWEHKRKAPAKHKLDKEHAKKVLHKMFGSKVSLEIVQNIADFCKGATASTVGAAVKNVIYLVEHAAYGDEYHEAFHVITQTILPRKLSRFLKKGLDKAMERKYGKKFAENATDRQREEFGANLCAEFFLGQEHIRFDIKEPFNWIKQHYIAFKQIDSLRMYTLFLAMKSGIFSHVGQSSNSENNIRFKYSIRGVEFDHIFDDKMYKQLVKSIAYYIVRLLGIRPDGGNIEQLDLTDIDKKYIRTFTDKNGVRQVIELNLAQVMVSSCPSEEGRAAIREALSNWETIKSDVIGYFSELNIDYVEREEEEKQDAENGDESSIGDGLDNHVKASYETSRHAKVTKGIRFLLSMFIDYGQDVNGRPTPKRNELGLVMFADGHEVLNKILSDIHFVKTPSEMMEAVRQRAEVDPIYKQLYTVLKSCSDKIMVEKVAKSLVGKIKTSGKINYNNERTITLMFNLISSTKMAFKRLQANKNRSTGMYTMTIEDCGRDYEAAQYRRDWGRMLAYGGTQLFSINSDGLISIRDTDPKKGSIAKLGAIYDGLSRIKQEYSKQFQDNHKLVLRGQLIDINNDDHAELVKRVVCDAFNYIGILITKPEFEYMLSHKYPDAVTKSDQLKAFFQASGEDNIAQLWTNADCIIKKQSNTNKWIWNVGKNNKILHGNSEATDVEDLYRRNSFVGMLSTYKYYYAHMTSDLMVLVSQGNKYYVVTDNNLISDVTNELNDIKSTKLKDLLSKFCYNYFESTENDKTVAKGSVILKYVNRMAKANKNPNIQVCTPVLFKTNDKTDDGAGYFDIGEREDYVLKTSILEDGCIITPTMSDKKTWQYLQGVQLPGIIYQRDRSGKITGVQNRNDEQVFLQLIEYAECELAAIEQTIDLLNTLPDNQRVANYHSGASVTDREGNKHKIANGTIFAVLTGIYDENDDYISFNRVLDDGGNYVSPEQNVKDAKEAFFNKSKQEQIAIIKKIILKQTEKELQHITTLGLVTYNKDTNSYSNVGLNHNAITEIAKNAFNTASPNQQQLNWAVNRYVRDIVEKSIMSLNEIERIYSGHPGFFKYKFSKDGKLMDRTTDEFKRFGGLISTGTNNNTQLEGLPEDGMYTCAEVDNDMATSEQLNLIQELMSRGEWLSAYKKLYVDELPEEQRLTAFDKIAEFTTAELKERVKQANPTVYDIIQKKLQKEISAYDGDSIDIADGGAYISPEMTEWLLRMCGEFDNKVAKAFEILNDPKSNIYEQQEAYKTVTTKVIGAQKYTAYGMRASSDGKTCIPYYNKMALFPVFKCIATGEFAKIYQQMQNNKDENGNSQPIHMLMINSAVKVGSQGAITHQNTDDFKFNTYKQPFDRLRKQFNTNPHHHEDQSMGTQMVKVALSSIIKEKLYKNGLRGQQLLQSIMTTIKQLSEIEYDGIKEQLFNDKGEVDAEKLSKFLRENLTSRDADRAMVDSIESQKDPVTGKSILKRPLAAISRMGWILSIIVSFINKRIAEIHTPGSAFYQRSIWKMEYDSSNLVDDDNLPPNINNGESLKMIIEDGPAKGAMDCILTIDYFADALKKAGLENASFNELKKALMEAGVIGQNAKANFIGYRIPTQAQSSIHPLRCVDVLPVIQHNIILPKEFTRITGSDFDIDKIFIGGLNFNLKQTDGKWINDEIAISQNDKLKLQNDLINNYITILTDEDSVHIAQRSIDNDTELFTDKKDGVIADLNKQELNSSEVAPYDFYCLRTQTGTKNQFLTGKVGIGPHALNNNSHILTMLYNVRFGEESIMHKLGLDRLDRQDDLDHQPILSWISALINGHVDNAKDPWVSRLNINKMTYNLENLLIRVGLGKRTFWILTQPVMLKMSEYYNNAQGKFLQEDGKSTYQIQKEAKLNAAIDIVGKELLDKWKNILFNNKDQVTSKGIYIFKNLLTGKDSEVLRTISRSNTLTNKTHYLNSINEEVSEKDIQAIVYYLDQVLSIPAQQMSNLVQYAKIDTKKQGKNIIEQLIYARGVFSTFGDLEINPFKSEDEETVLVKLPFINADEMYKLSFLEYKTQTALGLFIKILNGQMFEMSKAFQDELFWIATTLKRGDKNSLLKISDALVAKIKYKAIESYASDNNIDLKSLVCGNNTIYDRLNIIKAKIMYSDEYKYLKDSDGGIKNALLKLLIPSKKWEFNQTLNNVLKDNFENLKFVQLFDALDISSSQRDNIIQAWEQLLEDNSHPELLKFAEDLCVYAFITSGDQGGNKRIFNFVPGSWRDSSGYASYLAQALQIYNDDDPLQVNVDDYVKDLKSIALNNWRDSAFVPTINLNSKLKNSTKWNVTNLAQSTGIKLNCPIFITNDESTLLTEDEIKPYIKIRRSKIDDGSNVSYGIYELIRKIPVTKKGYIAIYAKINPIGREVDGYTYYDYRDNADVLPEYVPNVEKIIENILEISQNIDKYKQIYIGEFENIITLLRGDEIFDYDVNQVEQYTDYTEITSDDKETEENDTIANNNKDLAKQTEIDSSQENKNATVPQQLESIDLSQLTENKSTEILIEYTPTSKPRQTYSIQINGSELHIFNKQGKEVFKTDSVDRNRIRANVAVRLKKAVVVEHNNAKYVVMDGGEIISVQTGKTMNWSDENENKQIILYKAKQKKQGVKQNASIFSQQEQQLGEEYKNKCKG